MKAAVMNSCSTIGAISELVVSADLMAHGYAVFRALSPACSCDLVVVAAGKSCRVEVRTGRRKSNGSISFAYNSAETRADRFDVLAVVVDATIHYVPSIADWLNGAVAIPRQFLSLRTQVVSGPWDALAAPPTNDVTPVKQAGGVGT